MAVVSPDFESDVVLTVDEAARLLRVDRKTLYASISAGEVPAARIGGAIRLSRTALLRYLEGNGGPALGVKS